MDEEKIDNFAAVMNRIPEIAMNSPIIGYDLAENLNDLPFMPKKIQSNDICFCGNPIGNQPFYTCSMCGGRVHQECYNTSEKPPNGTIICIQCQQKACNELMNNTRVQIKSVEQKLQQITSLFDAFKNFTPSSSRDVFSDVKNAPIGNEFEAQINKVIWKSNEIWIRIGEDVDSIQRFAMQDSLEDVDD